MGRTGKDSLFLGHTSDFHNRTIRGKVALQANNTTSFRNRVFDRINHLAVSLARHAVNFFANGAARNSHAFFVQQASFAKLTHDNRDTTNFEQVLGHILPAWFQVDEVRRVAEDVTNILKIKINARLMRHRRQM
jgi:hypothetical protein